MRIVSGLALAIAAGVITYGAQVAAHHSTAEFNYARTVNLEGVIKEVQWTNPHSYVQVLVPNGRGGNDQWGIEIGAPAINVSMGWRRDSVKAGDRVKLNVVPARNGTNYGSLRYLTYADGRRLDGVAVNVRSDANGNAVFR